MYPWGPSQWPMAWCDLVAEEKLDCGAHSAVAREVARRSGVELLGVQLLIWAGAGDIAHWGSAWREGGVAPRWLFENLYYHEAVGVAEEDRLVVLDTTRNSKVTPDGRTGNGSVAAIRVSGAGETLRWGPHDVAVGQWTVLIGGDQ